MIQDDHYVFSKYHEYIEEQIRVSIDKHGTEILEYSMEMPMVFSDERLLQVGIEPYSFKIKDFITWKTIKDTKLYKVLG
jgi:hypothetical protein